MTLSFFMILNQLSVLSRLCRVDSLFVFVATATNYYLPQQFSYVLSCRSQNTHTHTHIQTKPPAVSPVLPVHYSVIGFMEMVGFLLCIITVIGFVL